ncbi:MAG: GDP-mannose 4,6-dehydratase, partial [Bacteroidota bacterium]
AKLYAYWITVNYREAYNMFACNGILFNHESPLRGENFITRKITRGAAKILLGLKDQLWLGNLDAKRDWGHAKDYALAMWLMLQQDVPQDYVIATGITTSVRDFVKMAFACGGIELEFSGKNEKEIAVVTKCNDVFQLPIVKRVLSIDPRYYRPTEVDILQGDATKARTELGWEPQYTLQEMADEMMTADIKLMRLQKMLKDEGYLKQIS